MRPRERCLLLFSCFTFVVLLLQGCKPRETTADIKSALGKERLEMDALKAVRCIHVRKDISTEMPYRLAWAEIEHFPDHAVITYQRIKSFYDTGAIRKRFKQTSPQYVKSFYLTRDKQGSFSVPYFLQLMRHAYSRLDKKTRIARHCFEVKDSDTVVTKKFDLSGYGMKCKYHGSDSRAGLESVEIIDFGPIARVRYGISLLDYQSPFMYADLDSAPLAKDRQKRWEKYSASDWAAFFSGPVDKGSPKKWRFNGKCRTY